METINSTTVYLKRQWLDYGLEATSLDQCEYMTNVSHRTGTDMQILDADIDKKVCRKAKILPTEYMVWHSQRTPKRGKNESRPQKSASQQLHSGI